MVTPQTTAEQRLKDVGIDLPTPPQPFGSSAEAVQTGNLLFLSGMLPTEGRSAKFIGRVERSSMWKLVARRPTFGTQRSCRRAEACWIARQGDARHSARCPGSYCGRCARSAEGRGCCLGPAAGRLRKRQESMSHGLWCREPSTRHTG